MIEIKLQYEPVLPSWAYTQKTLYSTTVILA